MAPMTPEAYCLALLTPNISLKKLPGTISTEQKNFCEELLEHPPIKNPQEAK